MGTGKSSGFEASELRTPDAQGRINIGKDYSEKTYAIRHETNGDIILHPVLVFHEQEAWLFKNPEALAAVKEGLEQSARGETHDLGDFTQFANDDEE